MKWISWLHLSDLHSGMEEQECLWPNFREKFYQDLKKIHRQSGPWDIILFTGDLTQRGSGKEFYGTGQSSLNFKLEGLLKKISDLNSSPILIAVPGNHDLVRPDSSLAGVVALGFWHQKKRIQKLFWKDKKNEYRQTVEKAFRPYSTWVRKWRKEHPLPSNFVFRKGSLPGDFSLSIEKNGYRLGIVGLNSAFLHLTKESPYKKLDLNLRQLHVACNGDPPRWVKRHHAAFLMTHHPPHWLNPKALKNFKAEIAFSDRRFLIHFFGHMHQSRLTTLTVAGSKVQREWQGTSLFGLENFGNSTQKRIHGYSAGRIKILNEDKRKAEIRIWPRILKKLVNEEWGIVPEVELDLEENNSISDTFILEKIE